MKQEIWWVQYFFVLRVDDESNYTEFKELLEHLLQDYDHDLWRTLGHIRRILGQAYIFDLKVALDEKDATKHIIYVSQHPIPITFYVLN